MKSFKFVWHGWRDPYDSCTVPSLVDNDDKIVWQGGHYYSGELQQNVDMVRKEMQFIAEKYGIKVDFSSSNVYEWALEDKRVWD